MMVKQATMGMRAHQVELISNITKLHNGSFLPTLFTVETF